MSTQSDLAATTLRALAEFVEANSFLTDVGLAMYPDVLKVWVKSGDFAHSYQWTWDELDVSPLPHAQIYVKVAHVVQALAVKAGES